MADTARQRPRGIRLSRQPGGLSHPDDDNILPFATTFTETRHDTDQLRSGSVLAAYHTRGDKAVRLEYMGGIAFVYLRRSSSTDISPAPPGVVFPRSETSAVTYGTPAVVGLDIPVRLTGQMDLVPQIRAQSTGGLTIRPGISVRVIF